MSVDSDSHASPTRFASGGRLTTRVGRSGPSTYQRHPLSPRPCGLCLSLLPALGTSLAVTPRDRRSLSQVFNTWQAVVPKGDGASSPCL